MCDPVGAILNPVGTIAGAVGAPPGVTAALNPIGAVAQAGAGAAGIGSGGPLSGAGGVLGALDPSNINKYRAHAPVNSWAAQPLANTFNATAPNIGYQAGGWGTDLWAKQANLSESDYANAISNAQAYQQQVQPWIHAEQDRASDSANALTGVAGQNVVSPWQQQMGGTAGQIQGAAGNVTAGTVGQEQGLANMLAQQAMGQGPSLAQAQFQRDLNQSQAASASAIGSQKGINPALASRLITQQTAASNQDAVTRAALQRAQEQFAAEQGLGSVLGTMGGQQLGQQQNTLQGLSQAGQLQGAAGQLGLAQQQNQIGALGQAGQLHLGAGNLALGQYQAATQAEGVAGGLQNQQNSNRISNLAQQQQTNLGLAGLNEGAAMQAQGINAGIAQANASNNLAAQQMNLQNTLGYQNYNLGLQGLGQQTAAQNANLNLGAQQINAGIAGQNSSNVTNMIGGGMGAAGAVLGAMLNQGGEVPGYAGGGSIDIPQVGIPHYGTDGGGMGAGLLAFVNALKRGAAKSKADMGEGPGGFPNSPNPSAADPMGSPYQAPFPGTQSLVNPFASNPSPYADAPLPEDPGTEAEGFAQGGEEPFVVPGKARFPGRNDPRNDTVPAELTPGEGVLPLSVMEAPDAPRRAAEFVAAIKAKHQQGPLPPQGYGRVLAHERSMRGAY